MREVLLAVPFGVAVGLALGLVGAGGSLLTVPILVGVLGETAREATTATLVIVGITAAAGAAGHARNGTVRWRVVLPFGAMAALGAVGGTAANRLVNEDALLVAFGALMLAAAYSLLARGPTRPPREGRLDPVVLAAGFAIGVLTGFFGVGGGFVIVPVLVLIVGLPIELAVGTSLAVIVIASAAALAGHLTSASLDWPVVGTFTGMAVLAAVAGTRLARRIPARVLRPAFAALVAGVGVVMVVMSVRAWL